MRLFFALNTFVILTACSSQPQVTVTRFAEVIVTLPPPTATVIPTPELNPEFLALQEQVAGDTQSYTIMGNGNIEGKLPDGTISVINGITLNPDGASYTIMVNGADVTIDVDKVSITDNGISIEGYSYDAASGNAVEIVSYTPDQIKEMTNTEILNVAPQAEGLEKFISPAGKHIVLYRNDEKKYTRAYNMLTKEMLEVIHVSTDPENPTPITMDDLTSGRLADSERLQCPGFSDKVIPGDWFYANGDTIFSAVQMKPDSRYGDPSKRPQKMCSYSEVVTDMGSGEKPYIVMGVANKNKDESVGFFHGWASPEDFPKFLKILDNNFIIITNQIRNDPGYPEKEFLDKTRSDVENWARQLDGTDIFPKEFERALFTLGAIKW